MRFKIYSRYYYTRLRPLEKRIYEQILGGIYGFNPKIRVEGGLSIDEYTKIVMGIRMDIPELFFVNTLKVSAQIGKDYSYIFLEYTMSPMEAENAKMQIFRVMSDFFRSRRNSVDIEKDIHDYLARSIKYNHSTPSANDHDIVGALIGRSCVCEGYAKAFKLFCDQVNIPCIVVVGESMREGHAWNIVRLGVNAFHVDVTWDSGMYEQGNIPLYYNVSDEFIGKDHFWERADYPPCRVSGWVEKEIIDVVGISSFANALEAMVMMRKTEFVLRFNKKFASVEEIADLIKTGIEKLRLGDVGTYSVSYVDKLDCGIVKFAYR